MRGVTKIDNLAWLNVLGSDLLIQRGLPVHEHSMRQMSSLEARKELMMATKLCSKKGGLISFNNEETKIYSQVYFGKNMWKLQITQM